MDIIDELNAMTSSKIKNLSNTGSTASPKKKSWSFEDYVPNRQTPPAMKYPTNDNSHHTTNCLPKALSYSFEYLSLNDNSYKIMNYPPKGHPYSVEYLSSDGNSYPVLSITPASSASPLSPSNLVDIKIQRERLHFQLQKLYKESAKNPHMRNVVEYVIIKTLQRKALTKDPRIRTPAKQPEWDEEELHETVKMRLKAKFSNKREPSLLTHCQIKNTRAYLKFAKKSLEAEWKKRDSPSETMYCFSGNIEMSGKDILRMCLRDQSLNEYCCEDRVV